MNSILTTATNSIYDGLLVEISSDAKEIVARPFVRKSYFNFVLYLLPMREKL